MKNKNDKSITVQATISAPVEKVWELWTVPHHIIKWNNASDDWHTPKAENDLRPGGNFLSRMEAREGSAGFDFAGTYDSVRINELIEYTIGDGRKVKIIFKDTGNGTQIIETFEAEDTNTLELQKRGWQSILDNFKKYAEENQ